MSMPDEIGLVFNDEILGAEVARAFARIRVVTFGSRDEALHASMAHNLLIGTDDMDLIKRIRMGSETAPVFYFFRGGADDDETIVKAYQAGADMALLGDQLDGLFR